MKAKFLGLVGLAAVQKLAVTSYPAKQRKELTKTRKILGILNSFKPLMYYFYRASRVTHLFKGSNAIHHTS